MAEVGELLLPQGPRARAVEAVEELLEASFILVLLSFIHPIACHAHLRGETGPVSIDRSTACKGKKKPKGWFRGSPQGRLPQVLFALSQSGALPPLQPLPSHRVKAEVAQQKKQGGKKKPAEPNPPGEDSPRLHIPTCHLSLAPRAAYLAQLEQLRCCGGKLFP